MKFHTAPMRLKRGPNDLLDLQAELDLLPPSAEASRHSADFGSWPKMSKRRTNTQRDGQLSLWELSEALATPNVAPLPADGASSDLLPFDHFALEALDALVKKELANAFPPPPATLFSAERFADAVFNMPPLDGIPRPTEEEAFFAMCLSPQEISSSMNELDHEEILAMLSNDSTGQHVVDASDLPQPTGSALEGSEEASPGGTPPSKVEVTRAHLERNGTERKEWTAAEDDIIVAGVKVHGCRWRRIAAQLPGRSDDAVRNRWNRLKADKGGEKAEKEATRAGSPEVGTPTPPPIGRERKASGGSDGAKPERVSWTRAEDATILQSVAELGHKWNKLAERLPGRTDHAIRNRFHRLQTMLADNPTCLPALVQHGGVEAQLHGRAMDDRPFGTLVTVS